jgi:hypothetical protein
MIEAIVDARRFGAGMIQSALAAPVGPEQRPRMVGPFAVLAHALPLEVAPGSLPPDFDVRPHPHIGLAAVSYMLDGHVTHRDSLGSRQEVGPGGINYMIAGQGIVHSERFDRLRTLGGRLEMLQILLALPDRAEDAAPSFAHVDAPEVPEITEAGAIIRGLAGLADGSTRIAFPAPMFLQDVQLGPGGRYRPPDGYRQRAVYVIAGAIEVGGARIGAQQTAMLAPVPVTVEASGPARVVAFGGEPVGPRYLWWNFLHSSLAQLEAAKAAWRAGTMTLPPGDTEAFTPAPPDHGRPLHRLNAPD